MKVDWGRYILGLNHYGFSLSFDVDVLLWSWNVNSAQVTTKNLIMIFVMLRQMKILSGGIVCYGDATFH